MNDKQIKKTQVEAGMEIREVTFKIEGTMPLIVNKFSEKAKTMMEETQQQKGKKGRKPDDPEENFRNSIHFFPDGIRTGFPAVGVKAAMTRAGNVAGDKMTVIRAKFHVLGQHGTDLIEIIGTPTMREDMVRVNQGKSAMIRYRAEYREWQAYVTIRYNLNFISENQLLQMLLDAGFSCGIGEWRPGKSNTGSYGTFTVIEE